MPLVNLCKYEINRLALLYSVYTIYIQYTVSYTVQNVWPQSLSLYTVSCAVQNAYCAVVALITVSQRFCVCCILYVYTQAANIYSRRSTIGNIYNVRMTFFLGLLYRDCVRRQAFFGHFFIWKLSLDNSRSNKICTSRLSQKGYICSRIYKISTPPWLGDKDAFLQI